MRKNKFYSAKKILKRSNITLFAMLAILSAQTINAGEDRKYEQDRLYLAEKIEKILISEKTCDSVRECRNKQFTFVSPATKGIAIATYGLTSHVVLQKIAEEAITVFYAHEDMTLEIEHFSFTKMEELNFYFRTKKPFIIIKMERK